ncbi:hypothetical protein CRG98_045277 [Punica granatum]|uniref:Uncharacterized protein n=1 Tax=Punica granatum TaxID=22663 RepID=A0A2I0HRK7_PUNGR|nr:hypothetical protein CRG98_045277 [Punica granatum]
MAINSSRCGLTVFKLQSNNDAWTSVSHTIHTYTTFLSPLNYHHLHHHTRNFIISFFLSSSLLSPLSSSSSALHSIATFTPSPSWLLGNNNPPHISAFTFFLPSSSTIHHPTPSLSSSSPRTTVSATSFLHHHLRHAASYLTSGVDGQREEPPAESAPSPPLPSPSIFRFKNRGRGEGNDPVVGSPAPQPLDSAVDVHPICLAASIQFVLLDSPACQPEDKLATSP